MPSPFDMRLIFFFLWHIYTFYSIFLISMIQRFHVIIYWFSFNFVFCVHVMTFGYHIMINHNVRKSITFPINLKKHNFQWWTARGSDVRSRSITNWAQAWKLLKLFVFKYSFKVIWWRVHQDYCSQKGEKHMSNFSFVHF